MIDEGYEASIEQQHLVLYNVPYVNSSGAVKKGTLVSTLEGSFAETTLRVSDHVIMFAGEYPCDRNGRPLETIRNTTRDENIAGRWVVNHRFSSKPKRGFYTDYYEKMSTYAAILSNQAAALDPTSTPKSFRVIEMSDDSPFVYFDNASGRSGISAVSRKLAGQRVAIVGLGGTGSYLLDLVAKTPVDEIHLFDGDVLKQHNAYRAPGAASIHQLKEQPLKVEYLQSIYRNMHRGIVAHGEFITSENIDLLQGFDIVFLCLDANEVKATIIAGLEGFEASFIDVGIGVNLVDEGLTAAVRTTTSTPANRAHVHKRCRIPMRHAAGNNEYARNIQVSELNMVNAAHAVIQWKQLCGFYRDTEHEFHSIFRVADNHILSEDMA
ncbi:ThiF family adenylyltransferase [Roseibium sp. HPY-6]|uniref:ThiF family adenylyltransferase n=1 Tax=Roseibium sp. HPY-6 TaxID=3229852 RepID=UPI00338E0E80